MAEFRSSPPSPRSVRTEDIYISNSYCNIVILVHVLVVRTKQQHTCDTNIMVLFQMYSRDYFFL